MTQTILSPLTNDTKITEFFKYDLEHYTANNFNIIQYFIKKECNSGLCFYCFCRSQFESRIWCI